MCTELFVMEETKVIYYVDEEETPYMMKIPRSPTKVTLSDLKGQLNRPFKKFFFKSMDDDIGLVERCKNNYILLILLNLIDELFYY